MRSGHTHGSDHLPGSTLRQLDEQMSSRALQERETLARRNAEFRAEPVISLYLCRKHTGLPPPHTPTGPGLGISYGHQGTLLLCWKMPSIVRKMPRHLGYQVPRPSPTLCHAPGRGPAVCTAENEGGEERML